MTGAPTLDVAVVGDGPAGSALARDLHDRGVVVALFGNNRPWSRKITKRRFDPNIQRVRATVNGTPKRLNVCTGCLKAGKVTR